MFSLQRKGMARPAIALALLGIAVAMPSRAAEFTALGLPGSQLAALSADGCVAAGSISGGEAGFRWNVGAGVQKLDAAISVRALSASGRYVAGSSLDAERREVASYWDADGRLHRLGGAPGVDALSVVSQAFGVTDAAQVVGSLGDAAAAFVWTPADGLRLLPGDGAARAEGVSEDGAVIYGWNEGEDGRRRGALWSAGTRRSLLDREHRAVREIAAASHSARVLLGTLDDARGATAAYRWRADDGVVALPSRSSLQPLHLLSSSEDGRLVVGSAGQGNERRAVIWSADGGLQPLERWLAGRGIALPAGWQFGAATAISADGRRLGGWGLREGRFDSFVLDLGDGRALPKNACAARR
ncbi:hypothetical protein [Dokdonella sp.]|uniref:hypothetical protein n=1 Tax=Dokdonella sp. TaxID=2291710 RepID=UPI001B1781EB|nr:hypothetical protein [Dokdonella sp.]MBO9661362.1 hypothetical protein [Dokdonella sp.]